MFHYIYTAQGFCKVSALQMPGERKWPVLGFQRSGVIYVLQNNMGSVLKVTLVARGGGGGSGGGGGGEGGCRGMRQGLY